jgi:hypothetical protein
MRNRENPLTGSTATRKRRNTAPSMTGNGDGTMIKYKALGATTVMQSSSGAADYRVYSPGTNYRLASVAGPNVVKQYATAVFKPGTHIRWEPTLSPTVGGRGFVGFTDNPEVMAALFQAYSDYETSPGSGTYATYANKVKGLANMQSFPAWQEWECPVPSRLRRKRFDSNSNVALFDENDLDRSAQVTMFAAFDGISLSGGSGLGSFWYQDIVDVEGLSGEAT